MGKYGNCLGQSRALSCIGMTRREEICGGVRVSVAGFDFHESDGYYNVRWHISGGDVLHVRTPARDLKYTTINT